MIRNKQILRILHRLFRKLKEKETLLATRIEERKTGFDISRDIPQLVSEAETRRKYIDVLLKDADWDDLREGYNLEYEVSGMPVSTNPFLYD